MQKMRTSWKPLLPLLLAIVVACVVPWGCRKPASENSGKLDANAYATRALQHARKDELEPAIADFSKSIALNPRNAAAYQARGVVYARQNDLNHAIADFTKAIALNPHNGSAYYDRGIAYDDQAQVHQALADYQKAIQLNPHDAGAHFNRALALDKLGRSPSVVASAYRQFLKVATPALAENARLVRQRLKEIEAPTSFKKRFEERSAAAIRRLQAATRNRANASR